MKSIYYWWYAKKRLAALEADILKDDGENYMLLAQRDMIELEIAWYRDESIDYIFILGFVLIIFAGIWSIFPEPIYNFITDMSTKAYEIFLTMWSNYNGVKGRSLL